MKDKNYVPIHIPQTVPRARIKPANLLTKILWKYIKLDVKIEHVKNPMLTQAKNFRLLCEMIPRVNNEKFK